MLVFPFTKKLILFQLSGRCKNEKIKIKAKIVIYRYKNDCL